MYVNLNEQFLEKTKEKARKESIESVGEEEGKHNLMYPETKEDEIHSLEIEDNQITIDIENELGYFSFTIPLDADTLEQLLTVVIKRMNKIKTLLESVK